MVFLGTAVRNMEFSNYNRKKSMAFEASSAMVDKFEICVLVSCASRCGTRNVKFDVLYVVNRT